LSGTLVEISVVAVDDSNLYQAQTMAKAGSSKPPAQSGTSRGTDKAFKGKGKPDKVIQKTIDLLKANEKRKSSGKGKEKAVLGDVTSGIERKSCRLGEWGACLSGRAQIYAGWYPSGKICGGRLITFTLILSRSKLTGQARALEILALQNAIKSAAYVEPIICVICLRHWIANQKALSAVLERSSRFLVISDVERPVTIPEECQNVIGPELPPR
jgi:hypothetical protein